MICINDFVITGAAILRIRGPIPSNPEDLLIFTLVSISKTSLSLTLAIEK
jgi:hypothetical protein